MGSYLVFQSLFPWFYFLTKAACCYGNEVALGSQNRSPAPQPGRQQTLPYCCWGGLQGPHLDAPRRETHPSAIPMHAHIRIHHGFSVPLSSI